MLKALQKECMRFENSVQLPELVKGFAEKGIYLTNWFRPLRIWFREWGLVS